MDTSEDNIKKCEKAQEMQKLRPQEHSYIPDLFWSKHRSVTCTVCEADDKWDHPVWNNDSKYCSVCGSELTETYNWSLTTGNYGSLITTQNHIWLPRQDELQRMLIPSPYRDYRNLLSFFFDWIDWDNLPASSSMEQLWLDFVMKEKYGKIWNGDDWINESK